MKQIILFFVCFVLLAACKEEDDWVYENPVSLGDIKLIALRADHKTLLPDGKAKMQFYITAYGIKELPDYSADYDEVGDSMIYHPSVACDTFVIPADMIPAGTLKLYDKEGNELSDFSYVTTEVRERVETFQARSGELESNTLSIQIRKLPEDRCEELVFPVIFHVLEPAKKAGVPVYDITEEAVKKNLERLNSVFNGLITTDPNGGKACIRFEAAQYDPDGVKLSDEGLHRVEVGSSEVLEEIEDFEAFVMRKSTSLIYDYRHYLNVWLINFPKGSSSSVKAPTVILAGDSIPGLVAKDWPVDEVFPEKPRDIGVFINMSAFLNPMSTANFYEISATLGQYFGLLTTQVSDSYGMSNMVDGDTDYCPDTYYYWEDNQSIFKNTGEDGIPDENSEFFTSYNVMDRYSKKTSITVDQVARIREHIEKCPSRWMYKSRFPFTGKQEDWDAVK